MSVLLILLDSILLDRFPDLGQKLFLRLPAHSLILMNWCTRACLILLLDMRPMQSQDWIFSTVPGMSEQFLESFEPCTTQRLPKLTEFNS